jgi:hypothetical protein
MDTPYQPPVDRLLAFGVAEPGFPERWPDYAPLGFTDEHVPELIRLMMDDELTRHGEDSPETYAGAHAWRVLGQMRAEPAIDALIRLLDDDDDWVRAEVPQVLGLIGPAALDPLRARLPAVSREPDPWVAVNVVEALVRLAERFPEVRPAVVDAAAGQLRWWARQDEVVNTYLVHALMELKAVETADLVKTVCEAGAVDPLFGVDWEDVQVAFGLLPERRTPREGMFRGPFRPTLRQPTSGARAAAEARRRDKARKRARKGGKKRR